jgi:hypothetical protein
VETIVQRVGRARPVDGKNRVICVHPAPVEAVMAEQLKFLLAHAGAGCHPDCRICRRLERIRALLLAPFS